MLKEVACCVISQQSGELPERESGGGSDASNKNDDANLRDVWGNQLEFLLSCVSMSVGLGNVWRFPFTGKTNELTLNKTYYTRANIYLPN